MLKLQAKGMTFEVPGSWSEMSLGKFFAYIDANTDTEVLSVLSGVSLSELRWGYVADLSQVMALLTWREKIPAFNAMSVPSRLELNGRTIKPGKLGRYATLGQMWDVEREVKRMEADGQPVNYITLAKTILSIYLYPAATGGPYRTIDEAMTIIPLIDALPVTQALPLAHAAFESFINPKPSGKVHVTQIPTETATWWTKAKYFVWCVRFGKGNETKPAFDI